MTDRKTDSPSARRRYIKKCSRQMLFSDWVNHFFAFAVVFGCYFAIIQFGSSISVLIEKLSLNEEVAAFVFVTYFTLGAAFLIPLIYGLLQFEVNALESDRGNLRDLFTAFSAPELFERSYKLFFAVVIRGVLYFLPAFVLMYFADNIYYSGMLGERASVSGVDVVFFSIKALSVVLLFAALVYSSKLFTGIYVSLVRSDEKISKCFFVGAVCMGMSKKEMAVLVLSFFPLCVVSLFTVGFLFIMYTIPYMLLSVTVFCKYLYQREMLSKNVPEMLYADETTSDETEYDECQSDEDYEVFEDYEDCFSAESFENTEVDENADNSENIEENSED